MRKLVLGFLCVAMLMSCEQNSEPYAFFVAGHVYGKPGTADFGPYKPFKQEFTELNNNGNLAFGVLTGDAVKKCKPQNWDSLFSDMKQLKVDFHLAPGNHDTYNRKIFDTYFDESFYAFTQGKDLHIILDANLDHWNISGDQLEFFKSALTNREKHTKNIFVYSHQLLWFEPGLKPPKVYVNSKEGRADTTNFDSVILPMLKATDLPVYMFAGDVGAGGWASDVSYLKEDNVHMIASGMGDGRNDNYIMIEVDKYSKPTLLLKPLSKDTLNNLKPLKEYIRPRQKTQE